MDGGKRVVDYKGVRDAKHLEQFVNKMLKSPVEELDEESFANFINSTAVAFVLVSDTDVPSDFVELFKASALNWQAESHFGLIKTKPKLLSGVEGLPGVVAFSDGEVRETLSASKPEGMVQFIDDNHLALVPELGVGSFYRVTHSGRRTVIAVVDPYKDSRTTTVKNELREMAKAAPHGKNYRFGWLDALKWPEFAEQVNIQSMDYPVVLVVDAPQKIHYVHRNSTYGRKQFLTEVELGNVPAEGEGASWLAWINPGPTGILVAIGVVMVGITLVFSVSDASEPEPHQKSA